METGNQKEMRRGVSRVGIRYVAFGAVVFAIQFILVWLLKAYFPKLVETHGIFLNFLVIIISIYALGFPILWMLCRKLPKVTFRLKRMRPGQWIMGAFLCAGICLAGTIVGSILHFLATLATGVSNNNLAELMLESKPFMRILTVGILAPIFEELIFRKLLIDHLAKYGELTAILASGIMFGLYHGNFSQCFFATGLGLLFAFVYVKTGRVRYPISFHMLVNLTSSVISVEIYGLYMKKLFELGPEAVAAGSPEAVMGILPVMLLLLGWLGLLGVIGIVGVVLLCVNIPKFKLEKTPEAPTAGQSWKLALLSPGMLLFYGLCVFRFLETYLPIYS